MNARRRNRFSWCGLALLVWATSVSALDTLLVGAGAEGMSWIDAGESSAFLGVAADSIWTWDVEPNINLATQIPTRGGRIRAKVTIQSPFGPMDLQVERPGLPTWIDGDGSTAWGPDEDEEFGRQVEIFIDLGGSFRVDRIRLFPRLDREHRGMVLGTFELATNEGAEPPNKMLEVRYERLVDFSSFFPNKIAVLDRWFPSRDVRYILLHSRESQSWEIAELEVYGDGTLPVGEFVSQPLFVRGGYPVWGQVLADGRDVSELPLLIQTRTGPDPEPLHYYIKRGDELEQVTEEDYRKAGSSSFAGVVGEVRGPVLPNPAWSPWQTVTEGLVFSPSPRRYLQFRVLLSEPGTVLRQLAFEYAGKPLAQDLAAEISPLVVESGEETEFTLSMEVHISQGRGDTGFRYLQVLTPATIHRVERVLVDDEEQVFTPVISPGEGFAVDIWQRVVQEGSFVQVIFRGSLFRDGTLFQVRAFDLRPEGGGFESVYQTAREEDVDPLLVGGQLAVRLRSARNPLVDEMRPRTVVFTPNGDGVNDLFEVSYNLLKLTRPVPVFFEIFDLNGRRVRQGHSGMDLSGQHIRLWDGRDDRGERVRPGLYLYRLQVQADAKTESRSGIVSVAH